MKFAHNGNLARLLSLSLAAGALVYGLSRAEAQSIIPNPDTPTAMGGFEVAF